MTTLFFIEPTVFRQQPDILETWMEWVGGFIAANPQEAFLVASSEGLLDSLNPTPGLEKISISLAQISSSVGYRRLAYVSDLFADTGENDALAATLREINDAHDITTVLSFTENPYLKRGLPRAQVYFMELGLWPRLGAPATFFFDPCGHQNGLLNAAWPDCAALEPPLSIGRAYKLWESYLDTYVRSHPEYGRMAAWFAGFAGRKVCVLALQPPDWPTYEGLYGPVWPEELIYAEAARDPERIVVPSYHPKHRLPPGMERYITREFANVAFLPESLAVGFSELLIPFADEVTTISSSVGAIALLHGKPVRTLGTPAFARAAEAMTAAQGDDYEVARLRRNLLAVLSNKLLHLHGHVLGEEGYLMRTLAALRSDDPIAPYLDFTGWDVSRLEEMLGLGRLGSDS